MKYLNIKIAFVSLLLLLTTQVTLAGAINGKQFKDWQGRCQADKKAEICWITQVLLSGDKKPLMITTVDLKRDPKYPVILIRVPFQVDSDKNAMFQVDKNKPLNLGMKCQKEECGVGFRLNKAMMSQFKRGNQGVIQFFKKDTGETIRFPISLSGFTKAINTLKKNK